MFLPKYRPQAIGVTANVLNTDLKQWVLSNYSVCIMSSSQPMSTKRVHVSVKHFEFGLLNILVILVECMDAILLLHDA